MNYANKQHRNRNSENKVTNNLMDKLVSLCKRRGFIFQSSEIYGGLEATYDYGPLGVELKNNVKQIWWWDLVTSRADVVGMDAAIFMNPKVWEASGHVDAFHDLMVDNKKTKKRHRLDHLLEEQYRLVDVLEVQPDNILHELATDLGIKPQIGESALFSLIPKICQAISEHKGSFNLNGYGILDYTNLRNGGEAEWTKPRQFNLMLKTYYGPPEDSSSVVYLRPETAQGIFVNFANAQSTARMKLPFGIAQIGKAFRNEITTGNFLFRTREFEQMELEYFVRTEETSKWLDHWVQSRFDWYKSLGIAESKLRLRKHEKDELAHYAAECYDVEYEFPFGWSELEGIADRGTYDLDQHIKSSGKKMTWFDPESNEQITPAVVESSAGVDRTVLTILVDAYHEEEVRGEKRVVLRLHPKLAPITVAVFPLVNRDGMPEIAEKIFDDLRSHFAAFNDTGGSIGRRYRRQDEAGTPYGITVDSQTLEDQTVTVRDRDTMEQERVSKDKLTSYLSDKLR